MKRTIALVALLFAGCATQQIQTTAFKTISAVDQGAKAMYGGYIVAAYKGFASTNQIPQITHIYQQIENDCVFAAITSQAGTNALATSNLQSELSSLSTAISSAETLTTH